MPSAGASMSGGGMGMPMGLTRCTVTRVLSSVATMPSISVAPEAAAADCAMYFVPRQRVGMIMATSWLLRMALRA